MKDCCYFGCENEVLYKFPSSENKETSKYFQIWKSVLDPVDQANDDIYIEQNFKLCHKHFEPIYRVGNELSVIAIPTLNNVHVKNKNSTILAAEDNIIGRHLEQTLITTHVLNRVPCVTYPLNAKPNIMRHSKQKLIKTAVSNRKSSPLNVKPVCNQTQTSKNEVSTNVENADLMNQNADLMNVQNVELMNVQNVELMNVQNVELMNVQNVDLMNIQNVNPMDVKSIDSANEQTVDATNIILQIDDPTIDWDSISHVEQRDDTTFILHKILPPTNDVQIATENCDSTNIQNVDLTNGEQDDLIKSGLENVDLTDRVVEQNVDTVNLTNNGAEGTETEVVWLPVSPKQQLQEFLDFSTPTIKDENESIGSTDERPQNKSIVSSVNHHTDSFKARRNHIVNDCYSFSIKELCLEWLKNTEATGFEQDKKLFKYITSKIDINEIAETEEQIKSVVSNISFEISRMWINSGENREEFYKRNHLWLNGPPISFTRAPLKVKKSTAPLVYTKKPINPNQSSQLQGSHSAKQVSQMNNQFLLRLGLDTNAGVFRVLRYAQPPFHPDILHEILKHILKDLTEENKSKLIKFCQRYVSDIKFKWMTADYKEDIFQSKFGYWLGLDVRWPSFIKAVLDLEKPKENSDRKNDDPALKLSIDALEKALTKKCSQDVSKVLHRLLHHPNDAARMRKFMANSECNCNKTQTSTEKTGSIASPEKDPLHIDTGTNNGPKNIASVHLKKPLKRLYRPSGAHYSMLKRVMEKLKNESERGVSPQCIEERNETEDQPLTERNKLEFGPVLDKLVFIKSGSVAAGSEVKISNRSATVVKVSNFKQATVLVPTSKIEKGAKVTAPITKRKATAQASPPSFKTRASVQTPPSSLTTSATVQPSPHRLNRGMTVLASPCSIQSEVTRQESPPRPRSGVIMQPPQPSLASGVTVQASRPNLKPRVTMQASRPNLRTGVRVQESPPSLKSGVKVQVAPSCTSVEKADEVHSLPSVKLVKMSDVPSVYTKKAVEAVLSEINNGALQATSTNSKQKAVSTLLGDYKVEKGSTLTIFKLPLSLDKKPLAKEVSVPWTQEDDSDLVEFLNFEDF